MIDVEKFIRAMKPSAMPRWRSGYVGWENGRLDKFFAWGEVHMCGHLCRWLETIVLFERLMKDRTQEIDAWLVRGEIVATGWAPNGRGRRYESLCTKMSDFVGG